jgi:hypothetical protein
VGERWVREERMGAVGEGGKDGPGFPLQTQQSEHEK